MSRLLLEPNLQRSCLPSAQPEKDWENTLWICSKAGSQSNLHWNEFKQIPTTSCSDGSSTDMCGWTHTCKTRPKFVLQHGVRSAYQQHHLLTQYLPCGSSNLPVYHRILFVHRSINMLLRYVLTYSTQLRNI